MGGQAHRIQKFLFISSLLPIMYPLLLIPGPELKRKRIN